MSAKLKSQPGSECGYFLCGNVAKAGDPIVVVANKQFFNVTPPTGGELWVTLPGRPTDIRIGDDARVSLAPNTVPQRASVVNLYRRDEQDTRGESKSTAKADGKEDEKSAAHNASKPASRNTTNTKTKPKSAPKPTSKATSQSTAETQFTLGLNMLANGNREKATEYFNKARDLDPSDSMRQRIEAALNGENDSAQSKQEL